MYYPDDLIEEVRSRNDIVDVISSYVNLQKKGNSYSACCPFHHEKTPSFHVSRDKQETNRCITALDAVQVAMYIPF